MVSVGIALRTLRTLAIFALGLGPCACDERRASGPQLSTTLASSRARASAERTETTEAAVPRRNAERAQVTKRSEPLQLIALSSSAYQASLAADRDAAYLLTSGAAYRLSPERAAEARQVELGFGATATRHALVFWSEGAVREISKQTGKTRRLAPHSTRPRQFVSSGDELGWVERSDDGRFSVASLTGERASRAYTSPGKIDAAAMLSDWIFFVERPTEAEWRIGGVRAQGGAPAFTNLRRGRAPSMLVAHQELYYYDGNRRAVLRLSPDLRREETLVTDFVCSPLAVAEEVYCANVEGVFELVAGARPRLLVKLDDGRAATDLAATTGHLFWIGDAGADKLEVSALALRE
jgi:hypothetical protein